MTALDQPGACALEHDAFVYASDDEYVSVLVPLIEAAVEAHDEVIIVVPERNAQLLREALAVDAGRLSWISASDWYGQPVRTIAAYERTLRDLGPGSSAFVIGEVQFGTTETEWAEWTRYESLINRVLERYPARVVCPYDVRTLVPAVVADARRTHPHLIGSVGRLASGEFVEPEEFVTALPPASEAPVDAFEAMVAGATGVRHGRRMFVDAARRAGIAGERAHDLAVAVSEVLTNAVTHGGGRATIRLWTELSRLVCVVEDEGDGVDDPLLGFRVPERGAEGGYGLWLARQVFDRVEIERSAGDGLVVHLVAGRPR